MSDKRTPTQQTIALAQENATLREQNAALVAALKGMVRDSSGCFCDPDTQFHCSHCKGAATLAAAEGR